MRKVSNTSDEAWERPGWHRWIEKRADGSTWQITENAMSAECVLLHEYFRASRIAMERGEEPPGVPPLTGVTGDEVVCVERTEERLGVHSRGSDGRISWHSESGMVYACDANGRPIVDPHFKNHDPTAT